MWQIYAIILGVVALLFTFMSLGWLGFMPSFEELENPNSNLASEIYSADQKLLGRYYIENRSNIHYSDLSPELVHALVATEDERFYNHAGIDMRSISRVLVRTVLGGNRSSGGGSTITQQLAKNLFPREETSKIGIIFRKLKEWVIAVKLERNYSKEEIIAMYLNTVDFGSNSFGIKTASKTYFDKTPAEINTPEAAMLIGLLKAPTYYSPKKNPKNAMQRRMVVLNQMRKAEYITQEQYDSLKVLPIDMSKYSIQTHNEGIATYFREYLRQYLADWCKQNNYNLYKDGLKIYTTINYTMQKYAEEAVAEHMGLDLQPAFFKHWANQKNAPFFRMSEEDIAGIYKRDMKNSDRYKNMKKAGASDKEIEDAFHKPIEMTIFTWQGEKDTVMSPFDSLHYYKYFLHTGMMSMEPQTGYVRAYVGGINYKYFKFDNVHQGRRQVGSTFKPYVYALALMSKQFTPCSEVPNIPVTFEGYNSWTPHNSNSDREGQMVSLKWALAHSVNYVSAYLMKRFTPEALIQLVHNMGITSEIPPVPSICLGTADISVEEMVGAMSTFANKGVYIEPTFVTHIVDKHGVTIAKFMPKQHEVMDEESAYLVINLMKGVVESGTGTRLRYKYGLNNPIAGKTGTTQNNSDGWFMGLTPNLVSGVWVGGEIRSIHFRSTAMGQGANMALPIWGLYMKKVINDPRLRFSKEDFDKPSKPLSVELNCAKYQEELQMPDNVIEGYF